MNNVDVLNLITYRNRTPIFEWYVVRCGSKNNYQKKHVYERNWTARSTYDNHSRFNSQHNLGGTYEHLMSMGIFTFIMNKNFI